jgi:hypothetical protein
MFRFRLSLHTGIQNLRSSISAASVCCGGARYCNRLHLHDETSWMSDPPVSLVETLA